MVFKYVHKPLKLTVSKEQVESFFKDGFSYFMENNLTGEPTHAIQNYSCHILGLENYIGDRLTEIVPSVDKFLQVILRTSSDFEYSLSGIIGSNPEDITSDGIDAHYEVMKEIVNRFNVGNGLETFFSRHVKLKNVNIELIRQIIIFNNLFDEEKRDWNFQKSMWGDTNGFSEYLDFLYKYH